MKKLLFLFLIVAYNHNLNGQVVLEHTYPSLGTFVLLSSNGEKVAYNDTASIYLYNMDHTLWKTITPTSYSGYFIQNVYAISDNLFNSDNLVELVVVYGTRLSSNFPKTKSFIINETGSILNSLDSSYFATIHYNQVNNNYKLATYVYRGTTYNTDVYSLPGTLPCGQCGQLGTERLAGKPVIVSDPSPNPASGSTRIVYNLPMDAGQATFVLMNVTGQVVKEMPLFPNQSYIDLNVSTYEPGAYSYQIRAANGKSDAKTLMVK